MTGSDRAYRVVQAGDSTLIVEFAERIDVAINARAVSLAETVRAARLPGIRDVVPAFRSVAIYFDPLRADADRLSRLIETGAEVQTAPSAVAAPIRIPVCYGGEFGPDLEDVAAVAGLTGQEVVRLHAEPTYRVYMLGFLPGFAYMGTVDGRIAAPRRTTPRLRVAAGSVGVAGAQTGIYPSESPGGWQVIGRTPVKPFDLSRPEPFLFAAGDAVRFYPISESEFQIAAAP